MDSMEVPDGYVQLPHGMGLVKEVKEAKEAKEPSPQGRYSLRPRKSPNRNTQTKLSLKITKPLPKGNVIDIKVLTISIFKNILLMDILKKR